MKKHITILFISLLSISVYAQEMWGTANSNYSGTMGTFLNPSTIVDAPYKYEIHFWGGNFFAGNNFVYIPSDKKVISRSFAGDFGNEKLVYDAGKDKKYDAYMKSMIIGPSFISNKGNSAWGFHTAVRNEWSATNIPYHFSKMMFEKFDYNTLWNQNFSSDPFSTAMLSWGEIGGTYGRVFMNTEKEFGITLTPLRQSFEETFTDPRYSEVVIDR